MWGRIEWANDPYLSNSVSSISSGEPQQTAQT